MAFNKSVVIKNDATYKINSNIKQYALIDSGFIKNKNSGAWTYVGMLEPQKGMENSIKLKVGINPELDGLTMSIVNAKENANIEVIPFQDKATADQYEFLINFLIDKEIIEK